MEHHRRSIRLRGYDYRQAGAYFVTICANERACLFGHIIDGTMHLSALGCIVRDEWEQTAILRDNVELHAFVVMPNHFHGILVITKGDDPVGNCHVPVGAQCIAPLRNEAIAPLRNEAVAPVRAQCIAPQQNDAVAPRPTAHGATASNVLAGSLGAVVRSFKAAVTRHANRSTSASGATIWQRNYHEHIIRNEADLDRIRSYIEANPSRWNEDSLYSAE